VKLWKRKPSLMLVLVAALIALLPLLAVLQFRWLGEVSQAERDRMQASLKTAVSNFSQDFDYELTRAYMTFQLDSRTQHERDWQNYALRYEQWMKAAPYPQLVSNIYLAEPLSQPFAPDRLQLYRFDRSSASFAATDWPASLEQMHASLQQEFDAVRQPSEFIYESALEVIDDEATALVIPIPNVAMLERAHPGPPFLLFT
jgi:hypothetical protein